MPMTNPKCWTTAPQLATCTPDWVDMVDEVDRVDQGQYHSASCMNLSGFAGTQFVA